MNWKEFCAYMNESLKNPIDITWVDNKDLFGTFTLNNDVYSIICSDKGDDIWTFKFYKYNNKINKLSPDLTNDNKNVFRVLPTIKNGFDYLIQQKNPAAIVFAALDSSQGRKKLYTSFSNDLKKQYGFDFRTSIVDDKQIFILSNQNINEDLLLNKIEKNSR